MTEARRSVQGLAGQVSILASGLFQADGDAGFDDFVCGVCLEGLVLRLPLQLFRSDWAECR